MKTMKKYIILAAMTLMFFACDDNLDIKPEQFLDSNAVMVNSDNIQGTLIGAYEKLRGGGELYAMYFNMYGEMLASTGDLSFIGTWTEVQQFISKDITTNNYYVERTWIKAYKIINIMNLIIDNIENVDENARNKVHGEALCMRSMLYFDMSRLFGSPYVAGQTNNQLAVPLILTPTYSPTDAVVTNRSSVDDVYSRVISDLILAKSLLEDFDANGTNLSTYAASAILARVYLQSGEYELAAKEANYVISSEEYTLTATPLEAFNNISNSTEDIFAIQQNVASSTAGLPNIYASLSGTGRGDVNIDPAFLTNYEVGDLRGGFQDNLTSSSTINDVTEMYYLGIGSLVNSGGTNLAKYGYQYSNIVVIRLSEMYLIRAEGNFEAGTNHGETPINDVNFIRNRALASPIIGSITREDIRNERLLELAFEGFRLHDLKRWHENIGVLPYNDPSLVLPIPEREIGASDGVLVQNEGY